MSKAKAKGKAGNRGGDVGAGGSGAATATGGEGELKEEEVIRELKLGEGFVKAKCLTNAEAAVLLKRKEQQLNKLTSEDGFYEVPSILGKSLLYLQRFGKNGNSDALRQHTDELSGSQLTEFEVCMLGNLTPESVEGAKALVPTIDTRGRMSDDKIQEMLDALNKTSESNETTGAFEAEPSTKACEGEDSPKTFDEEDLAQMSE